MTQDDQKAAIKEAIRDWMDERFATFGKWTAGGLFGLLFGWLVYGLMSLNGWHRP